MDLDYEVRRMCEVLADKAYTYKFTRHRFFWWIISTTDIMFEDTKVFGFIGGNPDDAKRLCGALNGARALGFEMGLWEGMELAEQVEKDQNSDRI